MSKSYRSLMVTASLAIFCLLPTAQAQDTRAADGAIHYRQSAFGMMAWNFGRMNAMLKGQKPFDAKEMHTRATRVAALSGMIEEGFGPGTDKGKATTEAKPEIWQNMADFRLKLADLQRESALLMKVAKGGNQDKIKKQFEATGGACKACHDKYKAD